MKQLGERFNDSVTHETVRKWFSGEARPLQKRIELLATILDVDLAWLATGTGLHTVTKDKKAQNAAASGVVTLVAGMIQICGGAPAFSSNDGPVDLSAVIKGALYHFHVAMGIVQEGSVEFRIPVEAQNTVVIGVLPKEHLLFEIYELDWGKIEEVGTRKGGEWTFTQDIQDIGLAWRRITTFANRV